MPDTIRTFIAIELSESMRTALAGIQSKLKTADADIKWVEPDNIHLTLKFLGSVEKNKIIEIKKALDTITARINTFTISLNEIGAFPNLNLPRIVWVGINAGELPSLVNSIENESEKLDFPKENRPFTAHVTIGRIRIPKQNQKLKDTVDDINKNRGLINQTPTIVDHITLFQSTLTPKGPIYNALHKAKLKIS